MSTTPTELLETAQAHTIGIIGGADGPTAIFVTGQNGEMDIESIKSLLDGFDPAVLLPDISNLFGSLEAVCRVAVMIGPIVLLVMGLAYLGLCYLFLAPKEANYYFGYRTYFGMGSVHAWRFTQRIAGVTLGLLGLILTIVMALISGRFGSMDVMDMVWKAVNCLVWEGVLALIANVGIGLAAFLLFDRNGEYRKGKKK